MFRASEPYGDRWHVDETYICFSEDLEVSLVDVRRLMSA